MNEVEERAEKHRFRLFGPIGFDSPMWSHRAHSRQCSTSCLHIHTRQPAGQPPGEPNTTLCDATLCPDTQVHKHTNAQTIPLENALLLILFYYRQTIPLLANLPPFPDNCFQHTHLLVTQSSSVAPSVGLAHCEPTVSDSSEGVPGNKCASLPPFLLSFSISLSLRCGRDCLAANECPALRGIHKSPTGWKGRRKGGKEWREVRVGLRSRRGQRAEPVSAAQTHCHIHQPLATRRQATSISLANGEHPTGAPWTTSCRTTKETSQVQPTSFIVILQQNREERSFACAAGSNWLPRCLVGWLHIVCMCQFARLAGALAWRTRFL